MNSKSIMKYTDSEILDFLQKCCYSNAHEGKLKNFLHVAFDKDFTLRDAISQILQDVDEKTIEANFRAMQKTNDGSVQ